MVSQDVHVCIPRTCEYITLHGQGHFSNVIELRIMRWRDYPESSKWALNVMISVLAREAEEVGRRGGGS